MAQNFLEQIELEDTVLEVNQGHPYLQGWRAAAGGAHTGPHVRLWGSARTHVGNKSYASVRYASGLELLGRVWGLHAICMNACICGRVCVFN